MSSSGRQSTSNTTATAPLFGWARQRAAITSADGRIVAIRRPCTRGGPLRGPPSREQRADAGDQGGHDGFREAGRGGARSCSRVGGHRGRNAARVLCSRLQGVRTRHGGFAPVIADDNHRQHPSLIGRIRRPAMVGAVDVTSFDRPTPHPTGGGGRDCLQPRQSRGRAGSRKWAHGAAMR